MNLIKTYNIISKNKQIHILLWALVEFWPFNNNNNNNYNNNKSLYHSLFATGQQKERALSSFDFQSPGFQHSTTRQQRNHNKRQQTNQQQETEREAEMFQGDFPIMRHKSHQLHHCQKKSHAQITLWNRNIILSFSWNRLLYPNIKTEI